MQSNVAQERRRQLSLTQERLKELLHYDPGTGRFRWRVQQGNRGPKGEAGTTNPSGYCKIRVDGVTHSAHRLAWLYVYGKQPTGDIDHKNGNPTDNRIANLQDRTRTEHVWCTVARNASATTGAYRRGRRWVARITVNGRQYHLGMYATRKEAADAYRGAALVRDEFAKQRRRGK